MARISIQALIGTVVAFCAYIVGMSLSSWIPGEVGRYLGPVGVILVATMIFGATFVTAIVSRFDKKSLFVTAAIVPVLMFAIGIALALYGSTSSVIHWTVVFPGLFQIILSLSGHTIFPVILAALTVFLLQMAKAKPIQSPNDRPEVPMDSSKDTKEERQGQINGCE